MPSELERRAARVSRRTVRASWGRVQERGRGELKEAVVVEKDEMRLEVEDSEDRTSESDARRGASEDIPKVVFRGRKEERETSGDVEMGNDTMGGARKRERRETQYRR